jgi:uncharacterized protein (TIGR03435 family)
MLRLLLGAVLLSAGLAAQIQPAFEVASIRPSAEQDQQANIGVRISGSQVRISYFSLKDYLALAYELPAKQIDGPGWLSQARFDIAAKLPDGSSPDLVPQMMQKLLADRFELKTHRTSKEFSVYALIATAGGPKLKEVASDAPVSNTVNVSGSGSAAGVSIDLGDGSFATLANNRLEFKKATTASIVDTLTGLLDRPVIDNTGLTGRYDLMFELTPEDYNAVLIRSAVNAGVVLPPQALRALDTASTDPFSQGLQKFGLTLNPRRAPLDVIVVDAMRKVPTEN